MNRLLIVSFSQFGYLTDTLYYCRYLKDNWRIRYLCWDYGLKRIEVPGVDVIYLSRHGGFVSRVLRFLRAAVREVRREYDVVFIVYFRFCSVVRLLAPSSTILLDIRTGYVMPGDVRRLLHNAFLSFESRFFRKVSVITEELRDLLRIPRGKAHIIPLGAEQRFSGPRAFTELRLLYVGTLSNRGIDKTVEGYGGFLRAYTGGIRCSYDIIGSGEERYERHIKDAISRLPQGHGVTMHGRIPHDQLGPYFQRATVGVAFVPIVPAQEPQPYTKVYEYLLAGLPVLATRNATNRRIITEERGVLVADTPEGVATGLAQLVQRLSSFDAAAIAGGMADSTWEAVVMKNVGPYLASCIGVPRS
jgi:glycosyltransferase involved in cell wall biosynthesis